MKLCKHCEGFIPEAIDNCPNCGAKEKKTSKLVKVVNGIVVGSFSITLMACYGPPPRNYKAENANDENKLEQNAKESNSSKKEKITNE